MNIINQLLALDLSLLESARTLISPQYALLVQIAGELVIICGGLFLVILWIYGAYRRDNEYKRIALAIFITIVSVFIVYAIINLGLPKWRLGATEIPGAIAPLIPHPIDNSFPSGHALFTGALLLALYRYYRHNWLIVLTIAIGLITLTARVLGGVHYPGDILGGLFFGMLGAHMLRPIVNRGVALIGPICIRVASWVGL